MIWHENTLHHVYKVNVTSIANSKCHFPLFEITENNTTKIYLKPMLQDVNTLHPVLSFFLSWISREDITWVERENQENKMLKDMMGWVTLAKDFIEDLPAKTLWIYYYSLPESVIDSTAGDPSHTWFQYKCSSYYKNSRGSVTKPVRAEAAAV